MICKKFQVFLILEASQPNRKTYLLNGFFLYFETLVYLVNVVKKKAVTVIKVALFILVQSKHFFLYLTSWCEAFLRAQPLNLLLIQVSSSPKICRKEKGWSTKNTKSTCIQKKKKKKKKNDSSTFSTNLIHSQFCIRLTVLVFSAFNSIWNYLDNFWLN